MIKRSSYELLLSRLQEDNLLIQVLSGPRQVGKTTLIQQVVAEAKLPCHYASADEPGTQLQNWIASQWHSARLQQSLDQGPFLLVLDEVQKIPHWSEHIKALWDEDRRNTVSLKVAILGSAPLLMQKGLSESLAGRFEMISVTHWTYAEMKEAFGFTLEQYCYFGGYPGAAKFIHDELRWKRYVLDALIEPTLAKDVLLMQRIDKPALLRQLFHLGCNYSAQILSYQKMLGQLHDAGNTTTLAHYLSLLNAAGMMTGLSKFTLKAHQARASSPKLQVYNTALISAQATLTFAAYRQDFTRWGRLVESTVGAYLQNAIQGTNIELCYWREGDKEVDFILCQEQNYVAIEVKSGPTGKLSGLYRFKQLFSKAICLLVGDTGIPLETFLTLAPGDIMRAVSF